jgi:hypothetical protein
VEIRAVFAPKPGVQLRKVSGRLTGVIPPEASVMLQGGAAVFETAVGADGTFAFSGIPDGAYMVLRRNSVSPATVSPMTSIQVTNDLRIPDIVIPPVRKIPGRVTIDGDAPTPPVSLAFTPVAPSGAPATPVLVTANFRTASPAQIVATLRGNGMVTAFEAPLADAEYLVRLQAAPPGYRLKSIKAGGADRTNAPIRIDADFQGEVVVTLEPVEPIRWVRARGKINGLAAPAAAGARIALAGNAPSDNWETTVGADGSFEFARVAPGVYTAILLPLENPPRTQRVTIDAANADNLQVTFEPRRPLRGKIVVEGGGTAPNIRLQLDALHPGATAPATPLPQPMEIKPGPDGQFTLSANEGAYLISITGIPPEYRLRDATADAKDLLRVPLQVPATEEIVLTFQR